MYRIVIQKHDVFGVTVSLNKFFHEPVEERGWASECLD
ncbi:hypothetical protein AtDm6_1325 [Acetobacter tropicalis]|uniref:Uncharacterized protein n=1 Tax=Acetobacter tropicalis TaxID=104102 RepID=A0A094YQ34_9PROT|nr:hypothetical protein AtDm6_1325 [Acetobacter tropicalis]